MILHRQLHLLRAMVKGGPQTVEDLAKDTGIGLRMVYRYLEQFRQVGLNLVKKGAYYNIDPNSPFLRDITNGFRFSEDEAITMLNVLNSVVDRTPQVRNLREKLSVLHDSDIFAKYGVDEHVAANLSVLFEAIKNEQMVCLRNYARCGV